ncbi:MAG: endonuclease III [bacterium]
MDDIKRVIEIIHILNKFRSGAKSELIHKTPLEFMVAVILSAQATDKSVNKVSPALFEKFQTVSDYANADVEELASYIKSINYYKTKAERIILACKFLENNFGGNIPSFVTELIKIPGIARKSANVISQEMFGVVEGVVVDTHVIRVSQRLGFTKEKSADKIEKDLMVLLPLEYWKDYGIQIVLHGRYICLAKNPKCLECPINKLCPSVDKV